MLESEKLAIAAHLHVQLRRKTGRVTDVEWMVKSADYAREVVRIALAEADAPELHHWARRLETALALVAVARANASRPAGSTLPAPLGPPLDRGPAVDMDPTEPSAAGAAPPRRYVGRLR